MRLDSGLKFEKWNNVCRKRYWQTYGGQRIEVNTGWQMRNRFVMKKLVDRVPRLARI